MAEKQQPGLKSAFDLAMERMAQRGEGLSALSPEKKAALAEIGTRAKAKIAELEILFSKTLEKARDSNDPERLAKAEAEHREAIARIRNREEDERRKVRGA
jgi:hypothetical protein